MKKTHAERSNVIYLEVLAYYLVIFMGMLAIKWAFGAGSPLPGLALYPTAFILVGWGQFSLSNGLHEALHKNFGTKHNELVASILTAYPIGLTMLYRDTHMNHHRYFGDGKKDPDYAGYAPFPRSRWAFIKRMLGNITGINALKQALKENLAGRDKKKSRELLKLAVVQGAILAFFILFFKEGRPVAGFVFYFLFWIFPLATVAKFFSSTRLLCEHGDPRQRLVYRTITGNFFNTRLLGAFKFHYHAEHHVMPQVPYTGLKGAKASVKNFRDGMIICEEYPHGYLNLLVGWFRSLPWTGGRKI